MALPTLVRDGDQVKTGPGLILLAPLTAAFPTLVAAGSIFTNGFPGWTVAGYTEEGMTVKFGRDTEDVVVAEEDYPIRSVTTSMTGVAEVTLVNINEFNIKAALNGGNWTTVTGTGATQIKKYSPPTPGNEDRLMLVHIGQDSDEILVAYQVYQSGEVSISRKKGADKASLSGLQFNFERPETSVSADVWNYFYAGEWADAFTVLA